MHDDNIPIDIIRFASHLLAGLDRFVDGATDNVWLSIFGVADFASILDVASRKPNIFGRRRNFVYV